jgi:hypothetical protein
LADQLTLSQPGGAHYAHHITKCNPGFSDLATGLQRIPSFPHRFIVMYLSIIME